MFKKSSCNFVNTNGCHIEPDGVNMNLVVDLGDNLEATTTLLPDIINVEQPNDKTVFVQFADGTKEVSVCSDDDTFSFETGVLICLFKKMMDDSYGFSNITGSTIYNKVIKYAMTKKDATKKERIAKRNKERLEAEKRHEDNMKKRKAENEFREDEIRMYKQAIIEAISEILSCRDED